MSSYDTTTGPGPAQGHEDINVSVPMWRGPEEGSGKYRNGCWALPELGAWL